MAESSSHNPSSSKITPKEEPVTLDKPESPNTFLPTDQVELSFDEISLTTNNEVALLYLSQLNSKYFEIVSYFISKCCLKEAFTRAPTQYKEYLCEFWYSAKTLDSLRFGYLLLQVELEETWVSTPLEMLLGLITYLTQVDYAKLIWEDIIHKLNKKIREKVVPYPRFISLLLEYMMPKYDNKEFTINPAQIFNVPVNSKAPKPSLQSEEVPQGKNPRAKSGLKRKQSLKHTSESKTEASKSKTGQSEKESQSSSAKDNSPSHHSPPTPVGPPVKKEPTLSLVVVCMHLILIEPVYSTSFHLHSESASGHDASVDSTAEADLENSAPNDFIPAQQDGLKTANTDSCTNEESRADEILKKIKLEDLSYLLKDTRYAFFTPDSLQDEPIIVSDESEEEVDEYKDTHATSHDSQKDELEQQKAKAKAEVASLKDRPLYPNINHLTNLLVTSLKHELSKLLAPHDFASCLPNVLKELPSKFTKLPGDLQELKKHVQDMEIELPRDLKEILTKLETFTFTISNLLSQVAELKNIQWELQAEFATMVENASGAAHNNVPSAGQASASPTEGEKNTTKDAKKNL
ncbi:hypothetical protein Tco_0184521 [Tanacetum coccineum]